MRRVAAIAACFALVSCEAPQPSPPPTRPTAGSLDGAAARIGDAIIGKAQVARIASAQGVSPAAARDLAIRDALFAQEARARGLDADPSVRLAESALLARLLVQDIAAAAEAKGPVTDTELDEVTARHWTELDCPESARTVHAVVILPKEASPDARAAASSLADSIRSAVSEITAVATGSEPQRDPRGPEDPAVAAFRKAATSIPKGERDVRVESLPPVVADGRIVSETGGGRFDPTFARAALQLQRRGDLSPVIETPFGYHVILMLERIPGHTVPREERRRMVREEVMSTRARVEKDKLIDGLRPGVAIHRDVDALLALVPVER